MGRIEGKAVMVTGAASGIGRATADLLAAEGAKVALADIAIETGRAAAAEIGGEAHFVGLDVRDEGQWQAAIDNVRDRYGRLDVLVNNAGIFPSGNIEDTTLEDWRAAHAVNAEGVFLGCKYAVAAMKETDGGSIVNISSIAALVGTPNFAAYSASKGAVRSLTKCVALHCAKRGYAIRCNSIHPSFIDTPMVAGVVAGHAAPDRFRAAIDRANPMGRIGRPEDVAQMVLYLATDESAFVNGAEMVVDGGTTAM
ncbi:MAG: SDR family oxidoreductase [Alphaproteobacteria bacterium]